MTGWSARLEWAGQQVSPVVGWALAGIFAILLAATAAVWALGRLRPAADWTELRQRVRTWWIMAAVFALAMVLSRRVSLVFFAFVSFLALKEYLSLIPTRRADRSVLLWAYLAIPLQYLWIDMRWYGMFIVFIPVFGFLLLPMRMVLIGETEGFLRAAGTLHWGLMATVFSLSHVAFLLVLPANLNPHGGGPALVLFLVSRPRRGRRARTSWPPSRPVSSAATSSSCSPRARAASPSGWPTSRAASPGSSSASRRSRSSRSSCTAWARRCRGARPCPCRSSATSSSASQCPGAATARPTSRSSAAACRTWPPRASSPNGCSGLSPHLPAARRPRASGRR